MCASGGSPCGMLNVTSLGCVAPSARSCATSDSASNNSLMPGMCFGCSRSLHFGAASVESVYDTETIAAMLGASTCACAKVLRSTSACVGAKVAVVVALAKRLCSTKNVFSTQNFEWSNEWREGSLKVRVTHNPVNHLLFVVRAIDVSLTTDVLASSPSSRTRISRIERIDCSIENVMNSREQYLARSGVNQKNPHLPSPPISGRAQSGTQTGRSDRPYPLHPRSSL